MPNSTGKALKFDTKGKLSHHNLTNNENFKEQLVVEGKPIQLLPPKPANVNIITSYWRTEGKGYEISYICCGKFDAVRFGVVEGGPYKDTYFYYNGLPTKQMPTNGLANYAGRFILSADHQDFDEEDYYRGDAYFAVDFAKKILSGKLTHKSFNPVNISANLSGNGFTGNATQEKLPQTNVEGKFYGDNAKELGGIFNAGDEWGGAFGAEKQ